jgi:hypothetical protein
MNEQARFAPGLFVCGTGSGTGASAVSGRMIATNEKPPFNRRLLSLLLCLSGLSAPGPVSGRRGGFFLGPELRRFHTIKGRGWKNRLLTPVIIGEPDNAHLLGVNIDGLNHHVGAVVKPRNHHYIADKPLCCAYTHYTPLYISIW